jgi:SAM-dependent methyltransferase
MSTGKLRLIQLREQTEAVEETMVSERERFSSLAKREAVKAVSSYNLFQTPAALASRMAALLGDVTGKRILEPSAGLGRLYHAVSGGEFVLVEQSPACCEYLYTLGPKLIQADFLECDVERLGGLFDFVLMNPPFHLSTDEKHIRHAHQFLKPNGLLVSLCYDGVRQNQRLRPLVDSWEVLPAGSFASEGTRAGVALVTWRKPG